MTVIHLQAVLPQRYIVQRHHNLRQNSPKFGLLNIPLPQCQQQINADLHIHEDATSSAKILATKSAQNEPTTLTFVHKIKQRLSPQM